MADRGRSRDEENGVQVRGGSVGGAERGRHGGVAGIQRARMIMAVVEVSRERGVRQVTVAHIVERSGVSRRTFYEVFEDREDCFFAALDEAVERAAARVIPAFEACGGGWRERVRAGLGALLEFLDDEPRLGVFCLVDALGAGPRALERRAGLVEVLVDVVHEGCGEMRGEMRPTRLTAEGIVGGVLGVLYGRLSEVGPGSGVGSESVAGLLGPLMGLIVLPYLGRGAARREVARPVLTRQRVMSGRSRGTETGAIG
jgi:AcrR family transcriptional regulator